MSTPYLDLSLRRFLDRVAAREPAPGGGSVAAIVVCLAAGLVEMAARYAVGQFAAAEHAVGAAAHLRARAAELADLDARVYGAVLAAYANPGDEDPTSRQRRIRDALHAASTVPLELAEVGCETAKLAATLAADGNPRLRGDAVTALRLAAGAVESAAHLVAVNVAAGDGDAELVRRAERCVTLVRAAAAETVRQIGV